MKKKHPGISQLPSGSWHARYTIDGDRVRATFPDMQSAIDWREEALSTAKDLKSPQRRLSITLTELAKLWIEECISQGRTESTLAGYRKDLAIILRSYGTLKAREITPGRLRRIVSDLSRRGWAASTQRNRINVVTAMCRFAMEMEFIPARALPVRRPPVPLQTVAETYTDEQVAKLLWAARQFSQRHVAAIHLGIDAGLRLGDMMRFRLGDLNYLTKILTVPIRSAKDRPKYRMRRLPVPESLVDAVRDLEPYENGRVIGKPEWSSSASLAVWLRPVWTLARLEPTHVHWLRHYWASRLANAESSATPYELMSWGGWSDLRMVLRYYHEPEHPRRDPVESLATPRLREEPVATDPEP